jgi:flagellar basal body P-ring protein FlgI
MILVPLFFTTEARAERIKDLTDMAGARANQLIGFGLVAVFPVVVTARIS